MNIQTDQLEKYVEAVAQGDLAAIEGLMTFASERLRRLTRKMLRDKPSVRRWEETDDVFQNSMLRLWRAMQSSPPKSLRHFFNLAALQIRRELVDLARHYYGPEGSAAKHHTDNPQNASSLQGNPSYEREGTTQDPSRLTLWSEFHKQVELLPPNEREVFEALYYHDLTQAQAAKLLEMSLRSLQRVWQSARVRLYERLGGELPG